MNADMPLRFPTSTIFGRFFNDYLDGLPIVEIYKHYATEVYTEEECTILYLDEGEEKGRLNIIHNDSGTIIEAGCIIASIDTRYQLYTFVKEHMTFIHKDANHIQLYTYNYEIFFFIYVCIEKDSIEESFSLTTSKEKIITPSNKRE